MRIKIENFEAMIFKGAQKLMNHTQFSFWVFKNIKNKRIRTNPPKKVNLLREKWYILS